MRLIRGLHNLRRQPLSGSVVTIGNYDGVHRGHQAVLGSLVAQARQSGLPAVVLVFEPTPAEFFAGDSAPARLTPLTGKLPLLAINGVDAVVALRFNAEMAAMSPDEFVTGLLVELLGARHVVVGDDFRFGRDRAGDFPALQSLGQQHGFSVASTATLSEGDLRVSSTRVRGLLAEGRMNEAAGLLGYPFRVTGRVVHGDKLGRTLGFPTANIPLRRLRSPVSGVFVALVSGLSDTTTAPVRAIANVGNRPTVNGVASRLEVHLLDSSADLYGRRLTVTLLHRLRGEQKFASLDDLKAQIADNIVACRRWFEQTEPTSSAAGDQGGQGDQPAGSNTAVALPHSISSTPDDGDLNTH